MPRFFLDASGNYYEATTDIPTPPGHTEVAQRFPAGPTADELRAGVAVTDIQFATAAWAAGMITTEELDALGRSNTLPAIIESALSQIDPTLRDAARFRFRRARTIARLDPFVVGPLKAVAQMTDEQLDTFFAGASQL